MTREVKIQQMLDDWVSVKMCEKAMIDDINEIYNDFESREKKLTSRLNNAKKRYESKCQELDDCSAFSTKQALEINDFESRTCENCAYFYESNVGEFHCRENTNGVHYVDKDFGCLKFKRKDK